MNQLNAISTENDTNLKMIEPFYQLSGPMQRLIIGFVLHSILNLLVLLSGMMKIDLVAGRGADN